MANVGRSIPVYLRVGRGAEHEIGTVAIEPEADDANLDPGVVGQLLRAAADYVDPPAAGERAQHPPRDRQIRGTESNR